MQSNHSYVSVPWEIRNEPPRGYNTDITVPTSKSRTMSLFSCGSTINALKKLDLTFSGEQKFSRKSEVSAKAFVNGQKARPRVCNGLTNMRTNILTSILPRMRPRILGRAHRSGIREYFPEYDLFWHPLGNRVTVAPNGPRKLDLTFWTSLIFKLFGGKSKMKMKSKLNFKLKSVLVSV